MMEGIDNGQARRAELARFLRARRNSIPPEQVGLTRQPRRRVTGLRRHEVADLAFVSDTWYTWIEQGRDIRISPESLDSVARALQLDEHAWRHVRLLAGVPVADLESAPDALRQEYIDHLEDLMPNPACFTTAAFDLVAWNPAYKEIAGDPTERSEHERNALWALFMDPYVRSVMVDWEAEITGVVARFRFESGRNPGDPHFGELIEALTEASAEFRTVWGRAEVKPFVDRVLTFRHPTEGDLHLTKMQMRPVDYPTLVLTVHRASDPETLDRLRHLTGWPLARGSHTTMS